MPRGGGCWRGISGARARRRPGGRYERARRVRLVILLKTNRASGPGAPGARARLGLHGGQHVPAEDAEVPHEAAPFAIEAGVAVEAGGDVRHNHAYAGPDDNECEAEGGLCHDEVDEQTSDEANVHVRAPRAAGLAREVVEHDALPEADECRVDADVAAAGEEGDGESEGEAGEDREEGFHESAGRRGGR